MKKILRNELGLSLLEVVASIIILSIILIAFFTFLVQSKKINRISESIADATYIAQMEMENLYSLSNGENFNNLILKLKSDSNYTLQSESLKKCPNNNQDYSDYVFEKIDSQYPNFKGEIHIKTLCQYENSVSFRIELIDVNTNSTKAILENVYMLKVTN
ncbi:hypothetical protein [Ureibacillus thermosphaericus]|uniref:hypothetical protein n=1 Tax=Ureibacillus thermosphaericus TaxID=51173 RepID=UPI000BBC5117|nr:hypothetical protein [Ureibacillus thermosphaericus]